MATRTQGSGSSVGGQVWRRCLSPRLPAQATGPCHGTGKAGVERAFWGGGSSALLLRPPLGSLSPRPVREALCGQSRPAQGETHDELVPWVFSP